MVTIQLPNLIDFVGDVFSHAELFNRGGAAHRDLPFDREFDWP